MEFSNPFDNLQGQFAKRAASIQSLASGVRASRWLGGGMRTAIAGRVPAVA